MLEMTKASLATIDELFRFKALGFELPPFPGYSANQWGIKAHNRPWIVEQGDWQRGQRVLEVGGAYSRLPEWLGTEFGVEPWIADDFGGSDSDDLWSRWGNPQELPAEHPTVNYVFENFGKRSPSFPDAHFDRIFTVSTLEHIPLSQRVGVLRDINRCTADGGRQLHSIDINVPSPAKIIAASVAEGAHLGALLRSRYQDGMASWFNSFRRSGVKISARMPSTLQLLDRNTLCEAPAVVYEYWPPKNQPKVYAPAASLLVVIEDR